MSSALQVVKLFPLDESRLHLRNLVLIVRVDQRGSWQHPIALDPIALTVWDDWICIGNWKSPLRGRIWRLAVESAHLLQFRQKDGHLHLSGSRRLPGWTEDLSLDLHRFVLELRTSSDELLIRSLPSDTGDSKCIEG